MLTVLEERVDKLNREIGCPLAFKIFRSVNFKLFSCQIDVNDANDAFFKS